ncbi:MAG TPA: aromatic ring-hydroxylating dioxygenase subunit alpha [bacterium]|jgi:phenylpropionate dioxygenase-like ring-hydroxylating dioxygenase large terminal subunit
MIDLPEGIRWPQEDNKIPREIFTDPDLFHLEMDAVFTGPVWTLAGHESEIPHPGDYKTFSIGTVPVIVIRTAADRVGVLVNACAHRGTRLVEGPSGNVLRGGFRCIYHMWTYDTEGRLIAVSLPDDFPADFRREDYGLPRARVDTYRGLIFATFREDTAPLRDYLAELSDGLDAVLGDGALRYLGAIRVIFRTNWKLYVENIYDGYHVTALHTGFQVVRLRSHGGERFVPNYERNGHLWGRSRSTPVDQLQSALRDMSLFDTRTKPTTDHNMMVVFPSGVVTDYFDTLQLRYVLPLAVDRTQIEFVFFGRQTDTDEVLEHRVRQGPAVLGPAGAITLEDAAALERVQLSAWARGENVVLKGTPKRFPPYRHVDEAPIRHFYQAYRRLVGFPDSAEAAGPERAERAGGEPHGADGAR